MDPIKAIKTATTGAGEEEIGIGASLISLETSLKVLNGMITECKANAKLVDDLVNVVIKAVTENHFDVDEETMLFIQKATTALTEAQSSGSRPAAAANGGGHQGSSTANS